MKRHLTPYQTEPLQLGADETCIASSSKAVVGRSAGISLIFAILISVSLTIFLFFQKLSVEAQAADGVVGGTIELQPPHSDQARGSLDLRKTGPAVRLAPSPAQKLGLDLSLGAIRSRQLETAGHIDSAAASSAAAGSAAAGSAAASGAAERSVAAVAPGGSQLVLPKVNLEAVSIARIDEGAYRLTKLPDLTTKVGGRIASVAPHGEYVIYSVDPALQAFTESLVKKANSPHVAVVAMEPASGRILAIAGRSKTIEDIELHAEFPAASLFKIVTSAAALEQSRISANSLINFRGGTYELERWNYLPNPKSDRRTMSVAEALGRSCNPVFARLALNHLSPRVIRAYADAFGFDRQLHGDLDFTASSAYIPNNDNYLLSRTAAGFGDVKISPVHAAAIMAGLSNGGVLPQPHIIDSIYDKDGSLIHRSYPRALGRIVSSQTAPTLMEMMQYTTTVGTSQREFSKRQGSVMNGMPVAAKTGTLRGKNPAGLNLWFIGAAPLDNPKIAVAVISVSPGSSSGKASYLGRAVMEKFFGNPNPPGPTDVVRRKAPVKRAPVKSSKKR